MKLRPLRVATIFTAVCATVLSLSAAPSLAAVATIPTVGWVPNAGVHALATDGTYIYLGGTFTQLTNPVTKAKQNAAGLVRLNLATGAPDPTWTASATGGDVRTLLYDPNSHLLYLGGTFSTVDGVTRTRLAAVSTTGAGALASWNPGGASGQVRTMIQLNSTTLLVGGDFGSIGGHARQHLAKISTSGALDNTFVPKINQDVFSLNVPQGASYVLMGGYFTLVGGQSRIYLAAVDLTTALPTDWNPGNPCGDHDPKICPAEAIVTTATKWYFAVGGSGGHLLAYDAGTTNQRWKVGADGDDQALALIGNTLYVGGHFGPGFSNVTRYNLAAVDATTGKVDPNFAPSATHLYPGIVAMLVTPAGGLAVGGDTKTIGGTTDAMYALFPSIS